MNVMKSLFLFSCLLMLSVFGLAQNKTPAKPSPTPAPTPAPTTDGKEKAAQAAAEQWLQLVDTGKYAESWEQAAAFFRSAISKESWMEAATKTRQPLGKLKTRQIKYTQATDKLQGAPSGQYFLMQAEAKFEAKDSAKEVISLMLEKDGKWRIVGYYVQ
jgi:Protein of unknown function (DUF4019)